MTYKLTLNMMMMVFIVVMKVLNNTLKIMIETVEMMNEMIAIIRRNYNKGNMMHMLMKLLMVKLMDAMINNSIAIVIDILRIALKYISIAEIVEAIELLLIMLITMVTAIGDLLAAETDSEALASVLMTTVLTGSFVAVVYNSSIRIRANDEGHNYECRFAVVKGSIPLC